MKRDYGRSVDLPPPRNRVSEDYGSQVASQRRPSYRDYPARVSGYPDLHRSTPRVVPRRDSLDDGYGQRLERPPPPPPHLSHREGQPHDYDTLSGSKRPYTAIVNTNIHSLQSFILVLILVNEIVFNLFITRMIFLHGMLMLVLANQDLVWWTMTM